MNKTPSLESLVYRAKGTIQKHTGQDNPAITALAAAVGGVAFGQYGYADFLFKQMNPETCNEEWLYLHANRLKVERIAQTYASGTCVFDNGDLVSLVPASVIVKTSDGKEYKVTTAGASDTAINVRAVTAGVEGNIPAGENLFLVTAVIGLNPDSIVSNSISGGAELEDVEHWRDRVILAYNVKNAVGRLSDYEFWAVSAHSDIDFAWSFDNTPALGQVTVYIATQKNDPILSETIRQTAQDYIEANRLAGCHAFVTIPSTKPVEISIEGVDDINARNSIDTALQLFFTERLSNRSGLQAHEISTVIGSITNQFTLASPIATTTMQADELLTYGGAQWL